MRQISQRLLDGAAASDDEAIVDVRGLSLEETVHYIKWSEAVTVGEVAIEAAGHPSDTAWALLTKVTYDPATGQQQTVRTTGAHGAFKHRVNVAMPDGTVTTKIAG